jgi:hypothetical protein
VLSSGSTQQFMHLEDQFKRYQYPIPGEEGGTEIHMIWMDNPLHDLLEHWVLTVEAFSAPRSDARGAASRLENGTIWPT